MLHYLVTHPDRLVTKDELLDAVWPDTAVSDAVVRVAAGALRKALGETASPQYIATVPRRGYRFVAPVTVVTPATPEPPGTLLFPAAPAPLPTPVTETCRRCGQVVPLPATSCHGCGQRLETGVSAPSAAPPPAAVATRPQAVGAFPPVLPIDAPVALAVPPTGAPLVDERKQVTVLKADIRGTVSLLHDFDPEVVQQLLEPALQAMIEAVQRYGGTGAPGGGRRGFGPVWRPAGA